MKSHLIALISTGLFFVCTNLSGQKNIYQSKYLERYIKTHKTLAIVPFVGTLDLTDTNYSDEELKKISVDQGYKAQKALEIFFKKSRKKRKHFRVDFQSVKTTNSILERNHISYDQIKLLSAKELYKILGAEGIISGSIQLNFPEDNVFDFLKPKSDYGRIAIKISDGKTGKLLWKYDKTISSKKIKNTSNIIDNMMKRVIRKFPYNRKAF